ncbi:RNA-binding protein [Sabulicella glaciei]|uniref:RNA-binding protein n=1 Tax=Sabulicella glaciei TaxID=2984948 RepID=A0ABT3NYG4_9PROT|nr:RNA-binding protein [Roseococcus sp. MDT2-1-1]
MNPRTDDPDRERGPLRRCIVSRETRPKEEMIRFVLGPSRELVPDPGGRLPGRGLWLTAQDEILRKALKTGAFAKAARGPVQVPDQLAQLVIRMLQARIRDFLGFARRGGEAVAGREAVLEWLRTREVAFLLQASDGSPAERDRLVGRREIPVYTPLSGAELGSVFGRDRAVHVAVLPGRLAGSLQAEAARLAGLLPAGPGSAAAEAGGHGSRPQEFGPDAPAAGAAGANPTLD